MATIPFKQAVILLTCADAVLIATPSAPNDTEIASFVGYADELPATLNRSLLRETRVVP